MLGKVLHAGFYHAVATFLRCVLTGAARVTLVEFGVFPSGAFVLASNHISHFDPPFLSGWLPRKIDWLGMSELFGTGWSRAFFSGLDVIPVDREGDDRQALRSALRRLAGGRVIGVFPEGGLRDGDASMLAGAPVHDGGLLLAAHANCPIVPVVILGSERLYNTKNWRPWRRARVYIAVGRPIFPSKEGPRGTAREQLRNELLAAVIALKDALMARCGLDADDLPHSPQQRMAEP